MIPLSPSGVPQGPRSDTPVPRGRHWHQLSGFGGIGGHDANRVDAVVSGGYLRRMRSVGIKALNSKLSEYVRLASSGETILVTDRDQVVAELGPLRETRSPILADAFLAEAVRSGALTPPRLTASGPPPKPKPVATLEEILADLDESRRDR